MFGYQKIIATVDVKSGVTDSLGGYYVPIDIPEDLRAALQDSVNRQAKEYATANATQDGDEGRHHQ